MMKKYFFMSLFTFFCSFLMISLAVAQVDDYNKGLSYFLEGDYEQAVIYMTEALSEYENYYVHYLIGLSYLYLEEGDLAKESFLASLALDPSFYLSYINLTRAEILLGNFQGGLEHLEEALLLEDKDFAVYHLRGRIYLNLQEWVLARDNFLKAHQLAPENIYVLNNLGLSHIYLGNFQGARNVLEEAIKDDPQLPYLYNNLGIVYENLGESQRALHFYSKALEIDPDHLHARLNQIRLKEKLR